MKWLLFVGIWILSGFLAYVIGGITMGIYELRKGYDLDEVTHLMAILVYRHKMSKVDYSSPFVQICYGWLYPIVVWPVFIIRVLVKNEIKAMKMIDKRQKTES